MLTQFDHKVRVVSLENLKAMCKHISGMCHRFSVHKLTANRCYVAYSNPDEYGNESPMFAVFPIYPSTFDKKENPSVVLDFLDVQHDSWDGEGWQAFMQLKDCPELHRTIIDGKEVWRTEAQIQREKEGAAHE